MTTKFIGQGFNLEAETSVAQVLTEAFTDASFHTFKCMVAFASPSGVSGLTELVNNSREHIQTARVIVGVDQGATSKEALESLIEWNADVFVFYSAQANIFHPKIYIFEGEDLVLVVIGSNNLTQMGLVRNIEGAVLITFNKSETEGENLLDEITNYFNPLLTGESPNIKPLTLELVNQLVERGIVPNEAERRVKYSKEAQQSAQTTDENSAIVPLSEIFPPIGLQKLPKYFTSKRVTPTQRNSAPVVAIPNPPPIIINNPHWIFNNTNEVLVAEIGGPSRWKQISFAKNNFEKFFGLPVGVGTSGQISLKYIEDNGITQQTIEQCVSARVKASKNFNLEPLMVRECNVQYDLINRPIIFFIKTSPTNFIYHFETSGSQRHTELQQLFAPRIGNGIRRVLISVEDLQLSCPSINL